MADSYGGLGGLGGFPAGGLDPDAINAAYRATLGRDADAGAVQNSISAGLGFSDLWNSLVNSSEGQAYAPTMRRNFITQDYEDLLGRDPDQAGLDYLLNSPADLYSIYDQIAASPEALAYQQSQGVPSWMDIIHQSDPLNDVQQVKGPPRRISDLLNDQNAIDMMAKGIYGEATRAKEGQAGELAVLNTMLNRWMTNGNRMPDGTVFPSDMSSILKGAYDAFSKGKAGQAVAGATNGFGPDNPEYARIVDMIKQRLGGQLPDNVRGATHYLNKAATLQNRGSLPGWATKLGNMQDIGAHTFMGQVPANLYPEGQTPYWFPGAPNNAPPINQFMGAADPAMTSPIPPSPMDTWTTDPSTGMLQLAGMTTLPGAIPGYSLTGNPALPSTTQGPDMNDWARQLGITSPTFTTTTFSSGGAQQPGVANPYPTTFGQGSNLPFLSPNLYPQMQQSPSMDFFHAVLQQRWIYWRGSLVANTIIVTGLALLTRIRGAESLF